MVQAPPGGVGVGVGTGITAVQLSSGTVQLGLSPTIPHLSLTPQQAPGVQETGVGVGVGVGV